MINQLQTHHEMPHLNHTGPEGEGPKTGRKLGKCIKKKEETDNSNELGTSRGMRKHSGSGIGKGKRLKSNKDNINQ